jgi:GT2 family glycosyltransferase
MSSRFQPTISVVIPVHEGGASFLRCLHSLAASERPPEEIIVVVDGDTDGSSDTARPFATKVLVLPTSTGPARARNLGAKQAGGDILFFLDADVTIPPDAIAQIVSFFDQHQDIAAIFGSYDTDPYEKNFLSQYKNLFHHYVHQAAEEKASTFWTGCGAVRREVFLKLEGFDESYERPCIEDIELGYRLRRAGYEIRLMKNLQVKHHKHWGPLSLFKADFFSRALPWTDLLLRESKIINDLNLKTADRVSVVCVYLLCICLLGFLLSPLLLIPSPLLVVLILWLNRDLYRFFSHNRGVLFALKVIPWHWFYFFYSGIAFLIGIVRYRYRKSALANFLSTRRKKTGSGINRSGKVSDG